MENPRRGAVSRFTHREYADMYLIYGETRKVSTRGIVSLNARLAARLYAERYPDRRHPTYEVIERLDSAYREGRIPGTRGRHIEGHWVLGLIEDGSEDLRLEVFLENVRSAELLVPLIQKHDSFQREFSINVWAGVIGNKLVHSDILPDNFNGLKLSGVYDKRLANVAI
ncbi:unnamed protein product [Parnassius apollo]|uniref:(apollo) hypothetical protein n=1 Tax=Parnassius apollo TaxID=110799 RepID=A0A8S3X799_PARAO|nr:unnamed protein product [Parnassius apollo]